MKKRPPSFGFTLFETLMVVSMIGLFITLEVSIGLSSYGGTMHRMDEQLIISALRKARSDAVNHVCANPNCAAPVAHGIFLTSSQLTVFEGSTYASRYIPADIPISFSKNETLSGATSSEIVFAAGSGDVQASTSLSLVGSEQKTESILINTEGMISP